jgi:CheY-like chemotaxis protein
MEQVILNLVINARDAMPSGGRLAIATHNLGDAAQPLVELSVSDNGIGMDAATRSRIFEPFFTTKGAHGTGLGLATVYGIIKQSDGDVSCESEIGKGTTFHVRLPRHAGVLAPPEVVQPQPVGGAEAIVVVDDDDAVRKLITMVLERRGYQVRPTADPREALQWFADGYRADLLLTDVRMPEMSGPAFARAVREIDPDVPIILMSGDAAPTMGDQDRIAGATFEQKPVTPVVLLRAVRARLDEVRTWSPS